MCRLQENPLLVALWPLLELRQQTAAEIPHRGGAMKPELLDRQPPSDVDAEAAILGVALTHPKLFPEEIATALKPEDFSEYRHRLIYDAMLRLNLLGKPIDIVLLVGELRDWNQYNADDGVCAATLVNLYRLYPLYSNLSYYLARVLEMSRRRRGLARGIKLVQAAHNAPQGPAAGRRRAW